MLCRFAAVCSIAGASFLSKTRHSATTYGLRNQFSECPPSPKTVQILEMLQSTAQVNLSLQNHQKVVSDSLDSKNADWFPPNPFPHSVGGALFWHHKTVIIRGCIHVLG